MPGQEFVVKAIGTGTNSDSEVFVRLRCEIDATFLVAEDIDDLEHNQATSDFRSTFLDCVGEADSAILSEISVQ